jgi:hypothetical protein
LNLALENLELPVRHEECCLRERRAQIRYCDDLNVPSLVGERLEREGTNLTSTKRARTVSNGSRHPLCRKP